MDGEPKRFGYLDALWQSFFSSPLYADVARHWRGVGFLYLLLVVIISWAPDLVKMQIGFQQARGGPAERYIRQVPAITITDGVASADVETPYFIKDPDNGKTLAIIDFTGKYTDLENTTAVFLLTRKDVITKQSGRETRTYSLAGVKQFAVDPARLRSWANIFFNLFVAVIAPFVIVFSFVFRIVQALIYAAVGMAFASMYHVKLGYETLLRLTCVALTPVIIFTTVTDLLLVHHTVPRPLLWLVHLAIAIWYVSFAVKSCPAVPLESSPAPAAPLA
jgi:hypothetical protein